MSAILLSKTLSHFTNRIRHENNPRNRIYPTEKKSTKNSDRLFILSQQGDISRCQMIPSVDDFHLSGARFQVGPNPHDVS